MLYVNVGVVVTDYCVAAVFAVIAVLFGVRLSWLCCCGYFCVITVLLLSLHAFVSVIAVVVAVVVVGVDAIVVAFGVVVAAVPVLLYGCYHSYYCGCHRCWCCSHCRLC